MTVELSSTSVPAPCTGESAGRRGLPAFALAPLAALVWWGVGFLPWIVDLVGDNILSTNGFSRSAVPLLSGSSAGGLVVSAGLGGVLAGLLVLLGRGRTWWSVTAVTLGTTIAMIVALAQSRAALRGGPQSTSPVDGRMLDGLAAIVVVMTFVGLVIGLLALAGPPGRGIALAGVAGLVPMWAYTLATAVTSEVMSHADVVAPVTRWLGAALLVLALVVIGVAPVVRLLWWVPAIALAWIAAPSVTAADYLGTSLTRGPRSAEAVREYVSASWQVWRQAAEPGQRPLTPWIVAIALALVVSLLLGRRGSRDRPAPGDHDDDTHVPADTASVEPRTVPRSPSASDGPGPAWP